MKKIDPKAPSCQLHYFLNANKKLEVFSVLYFNVMKKGSVKKKIAATASHRETVLVLHVGARRKMTNQQRRAGPSNLYKAHNFWGILRETPRRDNNTGRSCCNSSVCQCTVVVAAKPPGN